MPAPKSIQLEHLHSVTKLPIGWCEEALRLLATELLKKQTASGSGGGRGGTDDEIRARAAHQYAAQTTRPLILESLTLACWEAVIEYACKVEYFGAGVPSEDVTFQKWLREGVASKRQCMDEEIHFLWVQRQIGLRLGTDATNLGRWERFETLPGGEKVLGAIIIALQSEFDQIELPDSAILLTRTAVRTLAFIREWRGGQPILSKQATRLPHREEIAAVRAALRHEFADALVPRNDEVDEYQLRTLFKEVGAELKRKFPGSTVWRPKTLREVIREWATVYVLFRLSLFSGWPAGSEGDWNWEDIDADVT